MPDVESFPTEKPSLELTLDLKDIELEEAKKIKIEEEHAIQTLCSFNLQPVFKNQNQKLLPWYSALSIFESSDIIWDYSFQIGFKFSLPLSDSIVWDNKVQDLSVLEKQLQLDQKKDDRHNTYRKSLMDWGSTNQQLKFYMNEYERAQRREAESKDFLLKGN